MAIVTRAGARSSGKLLVQTAVRKQRVCLTASSQRFGNSTENLYEHHDCGLCTETLHEHDNAEIRHEHNNAEIPHEEEVYEAYTVYTRMSDNIIKVLP